MVKLPPAPPVDQTPRTLASYVPGRTPEEVCEPTSPELAAYCDAVRSAINDRYRELRAGGTGRDEAMRAAFDEAAEGMDTP